MSEKSPGRIHLPRRISPQTRAVYALLGDCTDGVGKSGQAFENPDAPESPLLEIGHARVIRAYRLEKVAGTILRAAAIAPLPLIPPERKAALMAARKAAQPARPESSNEERWQMLQDYYLPKL